MAEATKPRHRATYATDKRNGGYNIRVAGPDANMFAGRDVPVTMKDGTTHTERLERVVWSGKDNETGENVALYKFLAKPKEVEEVKF